MTRGALVLTALLLGATGAGAQDARPAAEATKPSAAIAAGSRVSLEYTLTDAQGTVLDSSQSGAPLHYTHGESQIIPGLEKALAGMRVGETKKVAVAPADAYGDVDPQATVEVPKEELPEGVAVGTRLVARSPDGQTRVVRVKEVHEASAIIDLNHPLAGMTLHFDVKVVT
ncbi:MAG: FKBP-type peptidyl-prolyl cis-trans isomerase, partial [Candidatus Rokuibacteriota bacterium]